MIRDEAWALITAERDRQAARWADPHPWGQGDCSSQEVARTVKVAVLTEELGEVSRAVLDHEDGDLRIELVQLAACCLAWLEAL